MGRRKTSIRNAVISIRLDEVSLGAVDLLVQAGLAQSRSEAAGQLIAIGVQSSEDLLKRAKILAESVQEMKNEMIDAIKSKNLDKVKQLLEQDRSLVNARNSEGKTAVLMSAYYHANEIRDLLLERGPELDLYEAAAVGATGRVKELLEAAPDLINSHNRDGYTLLGLASYFGNEETVRFLLEKGADVNFYSIDGQVSNAPLHTAIAGNHENIVRLLIEHGADLNLRCKGKIRPGFTPLHVAAHFNRISIARLLLASGADPTIHNDARQTAIDYAEEKGNYEIAKLMLEELEKRRGNHG